MVAGVIGSAVLVSGCAQLGIGASEPDEATQLVMEVCGIEVVEGDESDGDSGGSSYEMPGIDNAGSWNPVADGLESLESREDNWREGASNARAASRLDDQWDDFAEWHAENYQLIGRVVSYRRSDDTPTDDELLNAIPTLSDDADTYNANLDRIAIECGALMRTLPEPA